MQFLLKFLLHNLPQVFHFLQGDLLADLKLFYFQQALRQKDICHLFHSFWNKGKDNESLRLIDKENITKTQSKLVWLSAFRIVLKNVFDIIKIEPKESM